MDVGTGLALLGTAKLAERLIGPTVDYIGQGINTWTEKKVNNLRTIFSKAIEKAGDKLDEDGSVPPRVLNGILNEGAFCEDLLTAEYFSGVLTSSRTSTGRDDRELTTIVFH